MTDVKRLLDAATLPWRDMANGNSYLRDGTLVPDARIEGLRGTYNAHWVGWDDETRGHPDKARWLPTMHAADAALIVHAVNSLPDYEAAVDALERLLEHFDWYTEGKQNEETADVTSEARAALRRLRP